jgi:hypothetical protein
MRSVTLTQTEATAKVLDQMWFLLDVGKQSLVDGLLVTCSSAGWLLLLFGLESASCPTVGRDTSNLGLLALLEKLLLSLLSALALFPGKVAVGPNLFYCLLINSLQLDTGTCGDDVSSIDPSKWNAIDFERTRHEKNALREMLEKNHTLATESTGQKN